MNKTERTLRDLAKIKIKNPVYNTTHSPTVIVQGDKLIVSAEDGCYFADYYDEFRSGYPWIHPRLEEFAAIRGAFFEWENPGAISLFISHLSPPDKNRLN